MRETMYHLHRWLSKHQINTEDVSITLNSKTRDTHYRIQSALNNDMQMLSRYTASSQVIPTIMNGIRYGFRCTERKHKRKYVRYPLGDYTA